MIDMYMKCGFLNCGLKVFDKMDERDVVSWTELIVAYVKNGNMDSAGELFQGFPVKDMVVWGALLGACCIHGNPCRIRQGICFKQLITHPCTLIAL
ncbi:hypothetical protein I3843_11G061200 [Carya illinoinensis]|nr:hypothetical protein I3843_11G061200 [Carya illinoinensis]